MSSSKEVYSGVLLTYIYFIFFIFGLRFPLQASTYVCIICGIVLCLGLAFSRNVRCYVFLMLPVFFSKEGRQVILTYALYLTFTGPVRNTIQNMGILSDSMTCGQEMIKRTLRQIEDMIKAPFRSVKETLERMEKTLKEVIRKIKEFLDNVKRIILGILNVIKKAVSWLGSIINFCNKKLGTPFQRCMRTFDDAIEDCKAKMGILDFLCHVVHVVKALCYTVKFLDLICLFTEFVSDSIIGEVKKKLREFGVQVKNMFYVSIDYSHTFEYSLESSNATKAMAETIVQKIAEKVEKVEKFTSVLGWAFSFFFIFIFFRVYYYKYKFMASDRYDNNYITNYILELDLRRLKMNKETVLPLERRERKYYCRPTALRLLKDEQGRILKALMVLSLSTLEIAGFIVCDFCLYWVLFTIYQQGYREFAEDQSGELELYVTGRGALADFYRRLGKSLKIPKNPDLQLNPTHCLPDPVPPDKDRYIQIGVLTGICWILTITEAYGLRLRNIVMSHYYPERAKERAVWLYNHILRSRGSFLKFARRQLRRKVIGESEPTERVTLKERLFSTVPILGVLFGKSKENACLLCGASGTEQNPLKICKTPGCPGKYCLRCYLTLENVCTICQSPIEYGDVSDISEERDSSEDGYDPNTTAIAKRQESSLGDSETAVKTFKDLETRPKFKDLERNRIIDYAMTTDLRLGRWEDMYDKPLGRSQINELARDKAQSLLLNLKRQRLDKINKLKSRRTELVNELKRRIQEEKSRNLGKQLVASNAKYELILKKAKNLTKRLKERKSDELLQGEQDETSESDKENKESEEFFQSRGKKTDYKKLRSQVMKKVRALRERETTASENFVISDFNRERRPSGESLINKQRKEFVAHYSKCYTTNEKRSRTKTKDEAMTNFNKAVEVLIRRARRRVIDEAKQRLMERKLAETNRHVHFPQDFCTE